MTDPTPARVRIEAVGTDPDAAVAMFSEMYHGTRWTAERIPGRPFLYEHHAIGDTEMTLRTSRFHGDLQGEIVPTGDEYIVNWVTAGRGTVDAGIADTRVAPGTPVLFPADRPFRFAYSDFDQKLVHLDRALVDRVAAERAGTEVGALSIDPATPPTPEAIRTWGQAMGLVSRTLLGANSSPLLRAEMSRLAAVAFLELFPPRADTLPPVLLLPRNARLRDAVEFVHANAHLPITPTAVARAANVSVRTLQEQFRRELGETPTAFLRGVRLDRVRRELLRADPMEIAVQDVAVRWGFAHLGRFSGAYAQRFGEYPRETLRR